MKTAGGLFIFCVALCAAAAHKHKIILREERDYRNEADTGNTRGCSNLTLVLDNWKYAIMTQVKELLLHDHNTVLPEYGRIQTLSDAVGDLYKEFNAMKERLTLLTASFEGVEAFVDDEQSRRKPPRAHLLPGEAGAGGRPPGRRIRVVVRRIKRPVGSLD